MPLEPPGTDLPARPRTRPLTAATGRDVVRLAAGAGAAVMALSSSGDVLLLGVLLGGAAGSVWAGAAGVAAGLAVLVRWGSPSLDALAGAQSVLGPAGLVGPPLAAAATWVAGAALVLAAPSLPWGEVRRAGVARVVGALAFALTAAAIVAGPGPGGDLWVRVAASALAAVAIVAVSPLVASRLGERTGPVAAVLGGVAVVLAVVA